VAAVNLLWLAPLALAVCSGVLDGALAVAIAYAPLILIARRLKVSPVRSWS
jgi:Fuc2NAc and GlcNAc transferase